MFNRARLMELVRERALKFGDFTLASGKKSTYYLDGKQVTLSAEGLMQISYGLLDLMKDVDWECHWPTDPPKPPVKRRARRTPAATTTTRTRTRKS